MGFTVSLEGEHHVVPGGGQTLGYVRRAILKNGNAIRSRHISVVNPDSRVDHEIPLRSFKPNLRDTQCGLNPCWRMRLEAVSTVLAVSHWQEVLKLVIGISRLTSQSHLCQDNNDKRVSYCTHPTELN